MNRQDAIETARELVAERPDSMVILAGVLAAFDDACAGVAEVRKLHQPAQGFGRQCCGACLGFPPWPCATVRALDAAAETTSGEADYVSTGDPADDHMIEGIPADSPYQDIIEGQPSFRDRYSR